MSEPDANGAADARRAAPTEVEHGELVELDAPTVATSRWSTIEATESVTEPGKVMRIGSMVKQLLEEVRQAPLDEASRERLAEIYERSIVEVSERAVARPAGGAALAGAAVPPRRRCRARPRSGSPRRSSSGGSKGCSTGSRPRCSPSRSPPASSSSSSASSPAPPAGPGQRPRPGRSTRHVSVACRSTARVERITSLSFPGPRAVATEP